MDHISDKRYASEFHYGLVRTPTPSKRRCKDDQKPKQLWTQHGTSSGTCLPRTSKGGSGSTSENDRRSVRSFLHLFRISATWRSTRTLRSTSRSTQEEWCSARTTLKPTKVYGGVCTEHGASASWMAAATFLGAISKLPGIPPRRMCTWRQLQHC